jgi:hypothetical protein
MNKRGFYLASIVLVLVALGFHAAGRGRILEAQKIKAQNIAFANREQRHAVANTEQIRLSNSGRSLNNVGVVFMIGSVASLVLAKIRTEPGWYSVPLLGLVFDWMLQMML